MSTTDGRDARQVFGAFLRLGLTAFGGPIAHIGYLRNEFVTRRGWLDEVRFARLLALCQFLPGPASSQLGFAIGLHRAGLRGALAAFAGFTLPSALLMLAFAWLAPRLDAGPGAAAIHGLKLVAVAVVAHGVLGMARTLLPDARHALVAVLAAALVDPVWMQGVGDWRDAVIAAVGFTILLAGRAPLWTVAWCVLASVGVGLAVA